MRKRTDRYPICRRGLTLVELLVVVTIMMMLAAFVLPKLQIGGGARRTREAARMVGSYLGVARIRAIETGRPCGVWFERLNNLGLPNGAAVLFQVETPPPYAGDVTNATMTVHYNQTSGTLSAQADIGHITPSLIRTGDRIQFNAQGPWFTMGGPPPVVNGVVMCELLVDPANRDHMPWPTSGWSDPVPFQIQRQPMRTMAPPLVLPTAAVVDLGASGTAQYPLRFSDRYPLNPPANQPGPVVLMFSPGGTVSQCYWDDYSSGPPPDYVRRSEMPTEPLFFLVGRQDQLGVDPAALADAPEEEMANWQIMNNCWLVINPSSGMTAVSENAVAQPWYDECAKDPDYATPGDTEERRSDYRDRVAAGVDQARAFAKESRTMGGR